jgi:hypothetical protein
MNTKRKKEPTDPDMDTRKKEGACEEDRSSETKLLDCDHCEYTADANRLYCNGICVSKRKESDEIYLCNHWTKHKEMAPYICTDHSYQLQYGVLKTLGKIHLEKKEGRITYWRGDKQLVVKTDEVDGAQRRSLVVFSLFSNMPDDIVENLPVSYYDALDHSRVDKRFKQIYEGKDWETYFKEEPNELKSALETAMKKNDIAVLHKFISLLPNTDPLRHDLSNYLDVSLKDIGKLHGENQLLLLNMYDNFFDPLSAHKNKAMFYLISFNLPKLKTVDHIKAVFEMKFKSKPVFLHTWAMFRIGEFKHNPGAQLSLLKWLLALPAEYYSDKHAVFDYLRNNQEDIAEKNRRFLLVTPESDLETKVKP